MIKNQVKFTFAPDDGGPIGTVDFYYVHENTTMAQWLRQLRREVSAQPAKRAKYLGWSFAGETYPLETLTLRNFKRMQALMWNGIPRYVRCYDKGPDGEHWANRPQEDIRGGIGVRDRYTVVYSGRNGKGQFLTSDGDPDVYCNHGYMQNENHRLDTNDSGFSPAVGRKHPDLGLHIPFRDLPDKLKPIILRDYRAAWDLPFPLAEATLAQAREVEGPREILPSVPEKIQIIEHHADGGSPHYVIVTPDVAQALERSGLIDRCCHCLEGQYHAEGLSNTFTWQEFLVEVEAARNHGETNMMVVDPDTPEHHIRGNNAASTWSFCGEQGQDALPNISAMEYEEGLCNVPVCPDCVEASEISRSKIRPATEEDKKAAMAQAERQGLIVEPAAEGIHDIEHGGPLAARITYTVTLNAAIGEYFVQGQTEPGSPVYILQWFFSEELAHKYLAYCRFCAGQDLFPLGRSDWQRYGFHNSEFSQPTSKDHADAALLDVVNEQERIRLDRASIENEFTAVHWRKAMPIDYRFYWNEHGYCLALWDTGATDEKSRAVVGYVLIGPKRNEDLSLDIIFENAEGRSRFKDVVGPEMAKLALDHIVNHQRERDNSDGLAFSEREAAFFENEAALIDIDWPVKQEKIDAPMGRDQYGEPVPNDLIDIPGPISAAALDDEQMKAIMGANWYEIYGPDNAVWLAISAAEAGFPLEDDNDEWPESVTIRRVDNVLKRWSVEDGFYHA